MSKSRDIMTDDISQSRGRQLYKNTTRTYCESNLVKMALVLHVKCRYKHAYNNNVCDVTSQF